MWSAIHQFVPASIDLKTAFLQGDEYTTADRIGMLPPKDIRSGNEVWILNKSVYGLNDAPRRWWNVLTDYMKELGCQSTDLDIALMTWSPPEKRTFKSKDMKAAKFVNCLDEEDPVTSLLDGEHSEGIISLHVDDLGTSGTPRFWKEVIEPLTAKFKVGSARSGSFKHCGKEVETRRTENGKYEIAIHQREYIEGMELCNVRVNLADEALVDKDEHSSFRMVVGQLQWYQTQTGVEHAFDVNRLARKLSAPTAGDCRAANRLVAKVKSQAPFRELVYRDVGPKRHLVIFADSGFRTNPDKTSQCGFICLITGEPDQQQPVARAPIAGLIDWKSHRIARVCHSTTAAELLCVSAAVQVGDFYRGLMKNLGLLKGPCNVVSDAQTVTSSSETDTTPTQKNLMSDISLIRQRVRRPTMTRLKHGSSEEQLADGMTKHQPYSVLAKIRDGTMTSCIFRSTNPLVT